MDVFLSADLSADFAQNTIYCIVFFNAVLIARYQWMKCFVAQIFPFKNNFILVVTYFFIMQWFFFYVNLFRMIDFKWNNLSAV